jgi:pSer/pThr/pTyr-binding forkhead associated (FHA) protein
MSLSDNSFPASMGKSVHSIELILTSGSKAGTPAPIQLGYYLIGRHAECQIRPKSRSVSRRHCLLHHSQNGLAVFDLQSTRGTHVNTQKIEPHKWVRLNDGDQIRCGKVCFAVAIKQAVTHASGKRVESAAVAKGPSDAWQEADIAQLLESEDDAEREQRYSRIRSSTETEQSPTSSSDLSQYADTPLEKDDATPVEAEVPTHSKTKRGSNGARKERKSLSIPNKNARGPKKLRAPSFSFSFSNFDQLKMAGAVILAITFISFLGFQIVRHSAPPPIQILENID